MDRRRVLKMAAAATALAVGKRGVTQSREEQIKPALAGELGLNAHRALAARHALLRSVECRQIRVETEVALMILSC